MSELVGSDTHRVDIIAERIRGYAQEILDLRTIAQGAVAEMRNAWCGQDFEGVAQRWERDAGPRLTDVSSALATMAALLRAQTQEQRRASGDLRGSSVPLMGPYGPPGELPGGGVGAVADRTTVSAGVYAAYVTGGVSAGNDVANVGAAGTAYAGAEVGADASGSIGPDGARGQLGAEAFVGVRAEGNVSAAVAGLTVGAVGTAQVGAEARAGASGSIGPDGARGQLGAGAFVGGKAQVDGTATAAGVTATAGAEISYGIGAHADVSAEFSTTDVGVSVDIGATLGIGAGVGFDVSVNPQEAIADVGHAVDGISQAAPDVGEAFGSAVKNFTPW